MAAYYHRSFRTKHMWVVDSKVGDLNAMADEAIKVWNSRDVAISTLIVTGPGDSQKFLSTVAAARNIERIAIDLDYAIAITVDKNYYNLYRNPRFEVAAFSQGRDRYVHHMHGLVGGEYVKKTAGPYWLAFVGPLWKDGSTKGPAPVPKPPATSANVQAAQTRPPVSWADMARKT